jgi:hypothetical protein
MADLGAEDFPRQIVIWRLRYLVREQARSHIRPRSSRGNTVNCGSGLAREEAFTDKENSKNAYKKGRDPNWIAAFFVALN